jgi:transposase
MINSVNQDNVSRLVTDRSMCFATAVDKALENIDCMSAILRCQTKNRFYESTQRLIQMRRVLCIRRQTRRQYSAEEKIRIVLEGLRGEENISELCRREGIAASMYYGWSKEFLEAGKRRLAGDTARAATPGEVKDLRREATALKEVVADLTLENRLLKKSMNGDGEDAA